MLVSTRLAISYVRCPNRRVRLQLIVPFPTPVAHRNAGHQREMRHRAWEYPESSGETHGLMNSQVLATQGSGERVDCCISPGHPLARLERVPPGEARRHLQLVLTDRSKLTEGKEFSVISPRTWRLADLGAKHALLLEGVGWGNMPLHVVSDEISQGRLVKLDLPENPPLEYVLHALWRKDSRPGPAASWMLDALAERLQC